MLEMTRMKRTLSSSNYMFVVKRVSLALPVNDLKHFYFFFTYLTLASILEASFFSDDITIYMQ